MINRLLKKIANQAGRTILSEASKRRIRSDLEMFIDERAVRVEPDSRHIFQKPLIMLRRFKFMPYIATIMLVALFGGGTSVAAQSSLPGDFLYPVKIQINEEVRSFLAFSPESKVRVEIDRVQARLEEAETLMKKGKFDTEARQSVESNLVDRVSAISYKISDIKTNNQELAESLKSEYETILDTGQKNIFAQVAVEISPTSAEAQELEINAEVFRDAVSEKLIQSHLSISSLKNPTNSYMTYDYNCDGVVNPADGNVISQLWRKGTEIDVNLITSTSCENLSLYLGSLWKKGIKFVPADEVTAISSVVANNQSLVKKTGVSGIVFLGPTCPVVRNPDPAQCSDRPLSVQLQIKDTKGHLVATILSGSDGKFSKELIPGDYSISLIDLANYPRSGVYGFSVSGGEWTKLQIDVDTGIR
jgi:hypothetical protein